MSWCDFFQMQVLDKGFAYYQEKRVKNYKADDACIQANVRGSEEYDISINLVDENIGEMKCNCPYAQEGNYCKHMAAVLFFMEGQKGADETKEKIGNMIQPSVSENTIYQMTKNADETVVKEFLAAILENDEKLFHRFKLLVMSEISNEDVKQYKRQINLIFNRYSGRDKFIDYYHARGFISELEGFLNEDIQGLLKAKQYKETFELTNYLFLKVSKQAMDDSDGGIGLLTDICWGIWEDVLEYCGEKLKKEMFHWFVKHLDGSLIDYMEEHLESFLFAHFNEKQFLDDKLKLIEQKLQLYDEETGSWSGSYYRGKWTLRYLELLKVQNVSQEKIWDYCKAHLDLHEVRDFYIEELFKHNNTEEAIEILKDGKEKEKGYRGLVHKYSLRLKELYKQTGKTKEYEEEIWSLLSHYKQENTKLFKELKSLFSKDVWEEKREIVFKNTPDHANLCDYYVEEKLFDRLLKTVIEHKGLYYLSSYEKHLKNMYPAELLSKYELEIKDMADSASNRGAYQELVSILKKMQSYPEGSMLVKEIVETWQTLFKRRPAMMDELRRL